MKTVVGVMALVAASSATAQTVNCQTYYWGQTTCTQSPTVPTTPSYGSGVNWGLLNTPQPNQANNIMQSYQQGQEAAQRDLELRRERFKLKMCESGHPEYC